MKFPIFIIGCPRSGTTILGEFFEKSPYCNYYNEIDFWEKNASDSLRSENFQKILQFFLPYTRKNLKMSIFFKGIRLAGLESLKKLGMASSADDGARGQKLSKEDVTDNISKKAKSFLSEKHLVVKRTPNSLRILFLKEIFPNAKFVHIIRDGRDIACSLMNAPSGMFWSYIKPPGWKEAKKKYKGVYRCAWQCKATLDVITEDSKKIPSEDFIEIHYEDLIQNPEKIMRDVFCQLGILFENPQKVICKKVKNKISSDDLAERDRATVLDHSFRIARYKNELSPETLKKVEVILGYEH